jgi:hypothetical protein
MRSKNRVPWIANHRFLAGLLIALSALTGLVTAQNPVPLINQPLVPDAIRPGAAVFTLTVNGTGSSEQSCACVSAFEQKRRVNQLRGINPREDLDETEHRYERRYC